MVGCAVISCKRRSETANLTKDGVSYHTFPKDPILRKEWMTSCHRNKGWVPTRTSVICSDHFDPIHFQSLSKNNNRRRLNENAKPTKLLCDCKNVELNTNSRSENDMLDITQTSSMAPSESQVHTYQLSAKASDPLPSLKPMLSSKPFLSSQPLPSSASPYQLHETPRYINLKKKLKFKNIKIKRLQATTRYLKKKVNDLQERLNNLNEK